MKFKTGAVFQPSVDFTAGGVTIGARDSYSKVSEEAPETDLCATYAFNLVEKAASSFTGTDYFFPGTPYFDKTLILLNH